MSSSLNIRRYCLWMLPPGFLAALSFFFLFLTITTTFSFFFISHRSSLAFFSKARGFFFSSSISLINVSFSFSRQAILSLKSSILLPSLMISIIPLSPKKNVSTRINVTSTISRRKPLDLKKFLFCFLLNEGTPHFN